MRKSVAVSLKQLHKPVLNGERAVALVELCLVEPNIIVRFVDPLVWWLHSNLSQFHYTIGLRLNRSLNGNI